MIDQLAESTVVVFGRGDIRVKGGEHDTTKYPYVSFRECEPAEIGEKPGPTVPNSPIVKLVFLNEASLDVVLDHLIACKESFKKNSTNEKSQAY